MRTGDAWHRPYEEESPALHSYGLGVASPAARERRLFR